MADRISELPRSIAHRILSLVPMEDVVRTSVLSKKWNKVCSSFPVVDFGREQTLSLFMEALDRSDSKGLEEIDMIKQIVNGFIMKYVEQTLTRLIEHNKSIQKLRVSMIGNNVSWQPYFSDFNNLVKKAIETNNAYEIDLDMQLMSHKFKFPHEIFSSAAKFLTVLKLTNCTFSPPLDNNNNNHNHPKTMLVSLKELHMNDVVVDDEYLFQEFIFGCPLVETITLRLFESLTYSSKDIVRVLIGSSAQNGKVHVRPISQSFVFDEEKFVSSINEDMLISTHHPNLKSISFLEAEISAELLQYLLFKFPCIDAFVVDNYSSIQKRIEISSKRFKEVKLIGQTKNSMEVNIDIGNLQHFVFTSHWFSPPYYSLNGSGLKEATLRFYIVSSFRTLDLLALREHLEKFKQMEIVLNLVIDVVLESEISFVPEELEDHAIAPVYDLWNLKITINCHCPGFCHTSLVEGLFWASRPNMLSLAGNSFSKNEFGQVIEWLGKRLKETREEDEERCCSCGEMSCWRHCLKGVQIKSGIESASLLLELKWQTET